MPRVTEQRLTFPPFHNAAQIHDSDFTRHMLYHRKIVADEQVGQPQIAPQFRQQIEDLRLHRNIQSAGRFIADDNTRPQHKGARNRHALALAA